MATGGLGESWSLIWRWETERRGREGGGERESELELPFFAFFVFHAFLGERVRSLQTRI